MERKKKGFYLSLNLKSDKDFMIPYEHFHSIEVWSNINNKDNSNYVQDILIEEDGTINDECFIEFKKSELKENDFIIFTLRLSTASDFVLPATMEGGLNTLYFGEIHKHFKKSRKSFLKTLNFELKLDVEKVGEVNVKKAVLLIEIKWNNSFKKISLKKNKNPHKEAFYKKNIMDLYNKLTLYREMILYDKEINVIKVQYPEMEFLHAPLFNPGIKEAETIPSYIHFTNTSGHVPDENFFYNIMNIELKKNGVSIDNFVKTVDDQFNSKEKVIHPNFLKGLIMLVRSICATSNSLPYITDQVLYGTENEKKNFKEVKTIQDYLENKSKISMPIESFRDPLKYLSGDCEDTASLIAFSSTLLMKGIPEYKDLNYPWTYNGGFKSPLVKSMQKMMFLYVPLSTFGSVTAPSVNDKNPVDKENLPSIDTEEYKKSSFSGHAFVNFIPMKHFEEMMLSTSNQKELNKLKNETLIGLNFNDPNSSIKFDLKKDFSFSSYRQGVSFPWEKSIPCLLGEGTGPMHPPFLPLGLMYESTLSHLEEKTNEQIKTIEYFKELHKKSINDKNYIITAHPMIMSVFNTEIQCPWVNDENDTSMSSFYRMIGKAYTSKFMLSGNSINTFVFTQNGTPDRKKNISTNSSTKENDQLYYGLHIKDVYYGKDWCRVLPLEPLGEDEIELTNVVTKQIPPRRNLIFNNIKNERHKAISKHISSLNNVFKEKFGKFVYNEETLHFFCYPEIIGSPEVKEYLENELASDKKIQNIKLAHEIYTPDVSRVRLSIQTKKGIGINLETSLFSISSHFNHLKSNSLLKKNYIK
jgi:hypothetical protein